MKKVLAIIILIIIAAIISNYLHKNKFSKTQPTIIVATTTDNPYNIDLTPKCSDYEKYFVITRQKPLQVGEDIIVKYKKSKDEKIDCTYSVGDGDVEFKGESPDSFNTIYKDYLFIDAGTGIERLIRIYDLKTRKEVYKNITAGFFKLKDNLLSFRVIVEYVSSPTGDCPNYNEIQSMGGGVALYKNVVLDLDTLKESVSDKKICDYAQ